MIVVIDYGMGNLGSIANMLKKIGAEGMVSSDPSVIERADKLILPGVGAFGHGMKNLGDLGLLPVLNAKVLEGSTPLLGLCLGMQLLTRGSEEADLPGLGWIEADTIRFRFDEGQQALKIPHMGWNYVRVRKPGKLLEDMPLQSRFYFVHSYHLVCHDEQDVLGTAYYGYEFPAMIMKSNIIGVQFHPEKSHKFGMRLLKNFAELY